MQVRIVLSKERYEIVEKLQICIEISDIIELYYKKRRYIWKRKTSKQT